MTDVKMSEKKSKIKEIIVFAVLMAIVVGGYLVLRGIIIKEVEQRKYNEALNEKFTSHWEYVKTRDYAPLVDEYGTETTYLLEFDLKTTEPCTVYVNFQNGYGAKYYFTESVESTTEYQHFSLNITPAPGDGDETEAFLAFSAPYSTGIIPTVTKLKFQPMAKEK